jgi:hypothetical protein
MEDNKEKNKFEAPIPKSIDGIRRREPPVSIPSPPAIDLGLTSENKPIGPTSVISDKNMEPEGNKIEITVRKTRKNLFIIAGSLIVLVLVVIGSIIYFSKKTDTKSDTSIAPSSDPQKQLEDTLALVGKLTVLPQNDLPVLAIVSDPLQLQADAFFVDSQIGDRVLIYPRIGKAFLYRSSTNQIINITSFIPNSPESSNISKGVATTSSTKIKP